MKSYLKIIVLLLFPVFLFAQPLKEVPLRFMIEAADEALENYDYYNALEWYEKAYKEERNSDLAILIADLHMQLRDYKRAENWYSRVLKRDKEMLYIDERFYYGLSLKSLGRYNDAYAEFKFFIDSSTAEDLKPRAQLEIDGMVNAKELEENNDVVVKLIDKKVNSGGPEYGATEYADGTLYFSSFQTNKVVVMDGKDEIPFARIYTTSETDKGYQKPKALPAAINREGFHTGNVSFSADGRKMYFTRSTLQGEELVTSKLFVSNKKDSGWAPPIEVAELNGDFLLRHPATGELFGNEVLFFSSDMEGGQGGFDIYYATIKGDGFETPVNLGASINTKENEITPFYSDGTLSFSSDGYESLGGYDIYQTSWNGSSWSAIKSLGLGYNSPLDDMFFTTYNGGQKGYLISNRPNEKKRNLKSKTCCDDIYSFGIRQLIIDLIAVAENDAGPMKGAEITLVDLSGEAIDPITKTNENLEEYSYILDPDKPYKLVFKKEGYYPDSLEFNTVGILDDFTINKKKLLKPIPVVPIDTTPDVVTEIVTINQAIKLDNIYYDLDDDKILPDAEQDLDVLYDLLERYPDMVIELSSHTDAQGVSSYNRRLSQRRADSAKRYLTDRGVSNERIKTVGYGEDVILNRCVNGVRCSDDEHRQNRRTEFKILEGPQSIEIRKEVKKKDPVSGQQSFGDSMPKVKIYNNNIDLGKVKKGEVKELEFTIENVGSADLEIEIITTCHCTELDYSTEPLSPGQMMVIKGKYNSEMKDELRSYREVINIISNVEHIVDEAIFTIEVVE